MNAKSHSSPNNENVCLFLLFAFKSHQRNFREAEIARWLSLPLWRRLCIQGHRDQPACWGPHSREARASASHFLQININCLTFCANIFPSADKMAIFGQRKTFASSLFAIRKFSCVFICFRNASVHEGGVLLQLHWYIPGQIPFSCLEILISPSFLALSCRFPGSVSGVK